jgi:hypothetical protein
MVVVKLSAGDVAWATNEAVSRYNFNRARGNDHSGSAAKTWVEAIAREISGVLGEIAVARWLDKFPHTLFEDRKTGDVAGHEIRTTTYTTGRLILTKTDDPTRKYFLVTLPDHYTANIVGWLYGYEGQKEEHWNTDFSIPCYTIEQQRLHDVRDM